MASVGPKSSAPFGVGFFSALGRGVVRHPWYPVLGWIVVLVAALPTLSHLGMVTTNSATNLAPNAPSAVAQTEIDRLFPNQTYPTASEVVLTGSDVTGPVGYATTINLTDRLAHDPALTKVGGISSLYTAYGSYLTGMVGVTSRVIATAENGTAPLLPGVNGSASLLWGPPGMFLTTWRNEVAGHPSTPPAMWNAPSYNVTEATFAGQPGAEAVLAAFYAGAGGSNGGFNGTLDCAGVPGTQVTGCAETAVRTNVATLLPSIVPDPAQRAVAATVLVELGIGNFSNYSARVGVAASALAPSAGFPDGWIRSVWLTLGPSEAPAPSVARFVAASIAAGISSSFALPIPLAIEDSFVSPNGATELIVIAFTVDSGYTDAQGHNPVFDDVVEINRVVPQVLAATDPGHTLNFVQTGGAALDQAESVDLSASLAIVLPLTLVTLLGITILYFRAPLAPLLTFGALGIAIALGLAGVVVVGTLVTHVDVTALTLVNTFILGIGTDYSVFLVARYREELIRGADSSEAVVTAVTWAGQSIATSGAAALLATLALSFSGVALLSQWGMTLSVAIVGTVLIALTLIPAMLALVGPKVFWPYVGPRFRRQAIQLADRQAHERTYFWRAGRFSQRRPAVVVGLVLAASVPLLAVALTVPVSFDFYQQLPGGQPATNGLSILASNFGPGFVFPTTVLVTFAAPLLGGSSTNADEFSDLSALTSLAAGTSGVATVASPVGPGGAPLGTWLNYSSEPPGVQAQLQTILDGSVGTDGRTVALSVDYSSNGLSASAVASLHELGDRLSGYASNHPEVAGLAFGGGAPTTRDIQQQTDLATQRLVLAVSIGLIVVLLAVLRSALIPLLAVATIGLSIGWAWAITYLVFGGLFHLPLFFFVPTVMIILILGLGIDYNIFVLTRVREERERPGEPRDAVVRAVAATGGIITAAAVILASAFAILTTGNFLLLRAIGFSVAVAVVLDAMVVRTYLVPASLQLLGDRVWRLVPRRRRPAAGRVADPETGS
ncbi:MAG: MMPL family transporter [Thermoplasmata archaeon]|nr:MMPL family transporter [Thermoplasmata archaeon]